MFLKQKKGNLVAQFVVLIIIAVVLIFVVSSFGSKIWQAFFPNADKSSLKSFDAVFNAINTQSVSQKDYDSITMNIYIKDGYRITFFDNTGKLECNKDGLSGMGRPTAYAPKVCTAGKQCICLYKKKPPLDASSTDTTKREQGIVRCYTFDNTINIDDNFFDLNKIVCDNNNIGYGSYMFIKRSVYPPESSEKKDYVYVIADNDTNRALETKWSIPVCKVTDSSNPCYGKKDGETVKAVDPETLGKIYNYCKNKNNDGVPYKSLSVKCAYPVDGNDCNVDCSVGDVTSKCNSQYYQCEDYNQLHGEIAGDSNYVFSVTYTSAMDDYDNFVMCTNDQKFCNVNATNGCFPYTWDVYACKDSDTGETSGTNNNCKAPTKYVEGFEDVDCKLKFLSDSGEIKSTDVNFLDYITSYDQINQKCDKYMKDNFYDKQSMMTCKNGKNDACQSFIKSKKRSCSLKYIEYNKQYWLTHYDLSCDADVKAIFTIVDYCKDYTGATIIVP